MSTKSKEKTCFIVMPISDSEGYTKGHFKRVYDYLIKPACIKSEYNVVRADDVESSNYIIIDILSRIVHSDLVICDLSSKNPNVMYELGIRHAFNLPTILIKDKKTSRVFDIQGLRTVEYDESLRIDNVKNDIEKINSAIIETINNSNDINSIIELLGLKKPAMIKETKISHESSLIIDTLNQLSNRLSKIEENGSSPSTFNNKYITVGDTVYDGIEKLGEVIYNGSDTITIRNDEQELMTLSKNSHLYRRLEPGIPF